MKMNNKKSTKRALITSILSLALCMSMLIGTTFAWFTDSVSSNNNKIQAGNLDVELYLWNDASSKERISTKPDPIFGAAGLAQNDTSATLWEPGKTQVAYLSIKNEGSLDLKYKVAIDVKNVSKNLYEVMEYAITPDAKFGDVTSWTEGSNVVPGVNVTEAVDVALKAGEEHFFALSVHMEEEAGNEYMNGSVEFDIEVLAGQLVSEEDSFNNQYDALASYAGTGFVAAPTGNQTAAEIPILNEDDFKVGSVVVPAGAVAAGVDKLEASIVESNYVGNFTIADGMTSRAFDIKVEGLKANNDVPVKVTVLAPHSLNPATFKLYHKNTEITDFTYDPYTGYVIFETVSFSPFTIVYDANSEYVPTNPGGANLPQAVVDASPEYVGVALPWGSYGSWSPTEGLESILEAAYTFSCPTEGDDSAYLNWYCDFYVSLDRDLGKNELFLGGNYGSFGWVGFHNGTVTPVANEEIALLGSVTSNPWTYAQVKENVGTFICGVGDVDNALSGATFTVKLRLTNPENEAEFYDVSTINYTFN